MPATGCLLALINTALKLTKMEQGRHTNTAAHGDEVMAGSREGGKKMKNKKTKKTKTKAK